MYVCLSKRQRARKIKDQRQTERGIEIMDLEASRGLEQINENHD